jgi:hypothetical protein
VRRLADLSVGAGYTEGAERLYRKLVAANDSESACRLAVLCRRAGDHERAERLCWRALDAR